MKGYLKGYMIVSSKNSKMSIADKKLAIKRDVLEYSLAKKLNIMVLKGPVNVKEAARRLKLYNVACTDGMPITIQSIVKQHPLDLVIDGPWVKSTHF